MRKQIDSIPPTLKHDGRLNNSAVRSRNANAPTHSSTVSTQELRLFPVKIQANLTICMPS
jgi:hypothetical protein